METSADMKTLTVLYQVVLRDTVSGGEPFAMTPWEPVPNSIAEITCWAKTRDNKKTVTMDMQT
eukprot:1907925-Rhodomonas_salina.2